MGMTDERYDEIVNEAIFALKLDVIDYVAKKYPYEAKAFEAKLEELANSKDSKDSDDLTF